MTLSNTLIQSDKDIVVLVGIEYGSTTIYLCDTQEDLSLITIGGPFLSCPSLSVKLAPYSGVFDQRTTEISFEFANVAPLFALGITNGRAFAPTRVAVWQWSRSPGSDRMRKMFVGRVYSATRNPGGRQGIVSLTCVTPKAEAQRACGIVSDNQCEWTFGDPKTCTVDLAPLVEAGDITVVDRNVVTITGLSAHVDRYWHKGYIEADGIKINIREWVSGTSFILASLIPKEWEDTVTGFGSKAVSVTPGCDLRPNTCKGVWNNLSNIMCVGIAVPTYNPFFEDAS